MPSGNVAADDLRLGIERIERLNEEEKGIKDDKKDVFSEYKSKGFCTKTMKQIIKLRAMSVEDRREAEAMLDLYKGALGMLDGTPLGRWAAEKLEEEKTDPAEGEEAEGADESATGGAEATEPTEPAEPQPTVEDAREMGGNAAREGKPVTSNPFPARDERRAAWDEAWCKELGSDGMDIPTALKPKPKAKPASETPASEPAPDQLPPSETPKGKAAGKKTAGRKGDA